MDMIERVARAIASDAWKGSGILSPDAMLTGDIDARFYEHAQAAIAAMRVPTPKMVEAGWLAVDDGIIDDPEAAAKGAYTAMIDAALPTQTEG